MEDDGNRGIDEREPRALVIVPTRELGEQVARVFKTFTHDTRLRVRAVLGGEKLRQSRDTIAGPFEVLVATPGRLERLLGLEQLSLAAVRTVVLDEADQLLDMGFLDTVVDVVDACPSQRQLILLSATMPPAIEAVVTGRFPDTVVIQTRGSRKVVPTLTTRHVDVADGRRLPALLRILAEPTTGGTLLFANTREQCDAIAAALEAQGIGCVVHRGESDPVARRRNLRAFREARDGLLLSTDLGARGLDIEHVGRVINVHLPRELDTYLHRVGRTARAGREGLVVNLVTPRDAPLLAQLDDGGVAPRPRRGTRWGPRSR
jgi:superfamily II DNA/RNA helicase